VQAGLSSANTVARAAAEAQAHVGVSREPPRESEATVQRVCIVQRVLPDYRVPLFVRLHSMLRERGIQLRVLYGREATGTVPRSVELEAPWAEAIRNVYVRFGRNEYVWQECLTTLSDSDLVIVEHANRLLVNHVLLATQSAHRRVAFWGHGTNFQAKGVRSISARLKEQSARAAHWWFAYTNASARIVADLGFPQDRITVVNNAIDSSRLAQAAGAVSPIEVARLRSRLSLQGQRVALFCGRFVPDKRLDLVFGTALELRAMVPKFSLIMIGDGPGIEHVRDMSRRHPWIKYVGRQSGDGLAPFFALSDFLLMPGALGLVIVDSFATGVPLVTSRVGTHGPEIEYLSPGDNAIVVEPDPRVLARACARLLRCPGELARLRESCARSATKYTVEGMSVRFADGIQQALASS
jgi:L-malate glycosyltransferase